MYHFVHVSMAGCSALDHDVDECSLHRGMRYSRWHIGQLKTSADARLNIIYHHTERPDIILGHEGVIPGNAEMSILCTAR
jgi:hypothetical protein